MVEPEGVCTGVFARQDYVMLFSTVLGVRGCYGAESAGVQSCFVPGQSVRRVAPCLCLGCEIFVWRLRSSQNLRLCCGLYCNVAGALGVLQDWGQGSMCECLSVTCVSFQELIPVASLFIYG
jgi:hypothetical protein